MGGSTQAVILNPEGLNMTRLDCIKLDFSQSKISALNLLNPGLLLPLSYPFLSDSLLKNLATMG